ncbi:hypothetical protein JCM8097_002373 [Rhodosporidiobolus ruineniae]
MTILLLALAFLAGLVLPRLLPWALSRCAGRPSKELYEDADALVLNLDLERPRTSWFNMGWWKRGGEESFPEAAEEHCRQVALAAQLKPGQRVLEVGYGSGDSALFLAREFSPSSYTGLTSLPAQHALATRRAQEANLDSSSFRLLQGDAATDLPSLGLEPGTIDAILAVDCAYHFSPRSCFLSSALPLLTPSTGRLALSDLLLPPTPLSLLDRLLLRLICLAAHLPFHNLHTPASYEAHLRALGYVDVEIQDISLEVWPGFLRFVERREAAVGGVLSEKVWGGLKMYARVVRWYSGVGGGRQRLRYCLVSARRGGDAAEGKQ